MRRETEAKLNEIARKLLLKASNLDTPLHKFVKRAEALYKPEDGPFEAYENEASEIFYLVQSEPAITQRIMSGAIVCSAWERETTPTPASKLSFELDRERWRLGKKPAKRS
jgi:hypothetical protein